MPLRRVEPERKPPTFKEFLESWKPPPLVIVDALVRRPAAPAARPLPDLPIAYPGGLRHIAGLIDDADDMAAIDAAIDALPDAGSAAAHALIADAQDLRAINQFIATLE